MTLLLSEKLGEKIGTQAGATSHAERHGEATAMRQEIQSRLAAKEETG